MAPEQEPQTINSIFTQITDADRNLLNQHLDRQAIYARLLQFDLLHPDEYIAVSTDEFIERQESWGVLPSPRQVFAVFTHQDIGFSIAQRNLLTPTDLFHFILQGIGQNLSVNNIQRIATNPYFLPLTVTSLESRVGTLRQVIEEARKAFMSLENYLPENTLVLIGGDRELLPEEAAIIMREIQATCYLPMRTGIGTTDGLLLESQEYPHAPGFRFFNPIDLGIFN